VKTSSRSKLWGLAAKGAFFLLTAAVLWTAGLPLPADLVWAVLLLVLVLRVKTGNLVLLACSVLVAFVMCETVFRLLPDKPRTFYRPHEKFQSSPNYRPNVDAWFDMPHGDLLALDFMAPAGIKEPRRVRFKTDRFGYRNDLDYHGQKIVLVGDSFLVGNGSDQAEILPNVLRREFGLDAYAAAYPGHPSDYCRRIKELLNIVDDGVLFFVFVFEGNDFETPRRHSDAPDSYDRFKVTVIKFLGLEYPRFLFNLARQAGFVLHRPGLQPVEVHRVGKKEVGFYGNYIEAALAARPRLKMKPGDCPAEVMARLKAVFFIPTKYRVYFGLLSNKLGRRLPEPPPGYLETKKFFAAYSVPVIDLTPALRQKAQELLNQDRYVFWRDDTHWNGRGMKAAAAQIALFWRETSGLASSDPAADPARNLE